jgi:hypothetical protein
MCTLLSHSRHSSWASAGAPSTVPRRQRPPRGAAPGCFRGSAGTGLPAPHPSAVDWRLGVTSPLPRPRSTASGTFDAVPAPLHDAPERPRSVGTERTGIARPQRGHGRLARGRPRSSTQVGRFIAPAVSAPPGASASARERDVPPSSVGRSSPPQAPPENVLACRNRSAAVQQALPLLPLPLNVALLVAGPQAGEGPGEEDAGEQCKGKQGQGTHGTGAYQSQTRSPTPDLRHL